MWFMPNLEDVPNEVTKNISYIPQQFDENHGSPCEQNTNSCTNM